ncbi:ABC transporter permease [Tsukamurella sp. 8F]|uniref:ABC transporter permease n=1 Tax=unclassified Tsukamurella TaxID=2633480 RepID=UPI0023B9D431|nr:MULTISPECIES: ABC transporter permease [unclassified Tsukamurella]MDF0529315.1 ABC transporter permease [Tsukamurella sp. 8J]MDF0587178.1 ABC transporter permease [Tsukamurella sp. 8F]
MTAPAAQKPATRRTVPLPAAVGALSLRGIRASARDGDLVLAIGSPILFFLCFYTPLHRAFDAAGGRYAQYLAPVIVLQCGLFTAIVAAQVAGTDARSAARDRFLTLPIPRVAPAAARMVTAAFRVSVAAAVAVGIASVFGFRFHGKPLHIAAFFAAVIAVTVALSMLCDALGSSATNPENVAQGLMIPQLLLVMLSTGLVPAQGFPGWVQPFVRNQPISVLADAMRGWADGEPTRVGPAAAWIAGLLAVGVAVIVVAGRKEATR